VEKDRDCQKLIQELYPSDCLFTDVFNLIHGGDKVSRTKTLDPRKIQFKKTSFCAIHGRECEIPDFSDLLVVLGAPCILFSRFLEE